MSQDLTKLTVEELNKLDYDLEMDWQHYDSQATVHGNDDGYYTDILNNITAERNRICDEWARREEETRIEQMADQALYEMSL